MLTLKFIPMKNLVFFLLILSAFQLTAQKNKHFRWNQMLQKYVNENGQVDYSNWLADKDNLDAYIHTLEKLPPLEISSKEAVLAYWINAYNALTVQLILKHYPLKSIKEVNDPWDTVVFEVNEQKYTLGNIEHDILRKLNEPRIHFAINCASASCPKLRNTAFKEKQLEAQLNQVTRDFLLDSTKNKLLPNQLQLSRIFLWFGKDFGSKSERLEFIKTHSGILLDNPKIDYLPYDWSLNK